jgi:hypothetical protein
MSRVVEMLDRVGAEKRKRLLTRERVPELTAASRFPSAHRSATISPKARTRRSPARALLMTGPIVFAKRCGSGLPSAMNRERVSSASSGW